MTMSKNVEVNLLITEVIFWVSKKIPLRFSPLQNLFLVSVLGVSVFRQLGYLDRIFPGIGLVFSQDPEFVVFIGIMLSNARKHFENWI